MNLDEVSSNWYLPNPSGGVVACTIRQWSEQGDNHRRVALDTVGDAKVSTVFLGLDHGYATTEPVLWETMIFGGPHDQDAARYTSREDAKAGHAFVVDSLWHGECPFPDDGPT